MHLTDLLCLHWLRQFGLACAAAALAQPLTVAAARTENAIESTAVHPVVGLWQSAVTLSAPSDGGADHKNAAKTCRETLDYRVNHIRLGTSGKEITRASFDVSAGPSAAGFYRLTETELASNAKADCAGDLHAATDDPSVRFLQFSPQRDRFIVCKAESLAACFGPFKRQP